MLFNQKTSSQPNDGSYVHISRTFRGLYDHGQFEPSKVGDRVSKEEMYFVIQRINKAKNSLVVFQITFIVVWILVVLFSLIGHSGELIEDGSWILFFMIWMGILIFGVSNMNQAWLMNLQKATDEENDMLLHARGLHLALGPNGRYLTLHLNIVQQTAESELQQPVGYVNHQENHPLMNQASL
eukprot:TRINITY_DN9182_c0_g1_i1.p1 TRINITY_DN9182_c0_g1~~TRINITY_DN9182_c0_g1_i1.p1  ORF type:complete len:183 (-),score=23.36 TRINITY_DN9182_c0_g1_i1:86-634(-)